MLYPALTEAVGTESETLYDDQAELKEFIAQEKQSEGEGLIAWMAKIEAAINAHVMMEEQDVFPAFVDTQTPSALKVLGAQLLQLKQRSG